MIRFKIFLQRRKVHKLIDKYGLLDNRTYIESCKLDELVNIGMKRRNRR